MRKHIESSVPRIKNAPQQKSNRVKKDGKKQGVGWVVGELFAANFKTLSWLALGTLPVTLHLGKNKIGLSKRLRILNLMETAKITFSIHKANIKCWGISHYFVFSAPLLSPLRG